MGLKTLVTADEFERMPEPEEAVRLELDEGKVIRMAPASEGHGNIASEIVFQLKLFLREHPLGTVYTAETGFRLGNDTVRAPDVAFVKKERFDPAGRDRFVQGAPDLAVEIVSPSERGPQIIRKVKQYLEAGGQVVWVVRPAKRTVQVFESSGAERTLGLDGVLDAPALLPGFSLCVGDIFG